ncbi:kda protein in nof-fb transposable element, partial [Lasius niger]
MQEDDVVEPPHLYNANVLRVAKHEIMQKNYIDKDPLKALYLMQLAEEILRGILIIARSETEGMARNNERTVCETYKIKMKSLLTSSNQEIPIDDESEQPNNIDVEEANSSFNKWDQWAKDIDNDVQKKIADNEGDRENAHFMPAFANRLMKDIKLIPMWSCICKEKFGYGRVPASSASVESDFNIVKNIFLKTEQTPMRADEFLMKHVKFISGRIKLINVNFQEKEQGNKDTRDMAEPMESNMEIITPDRIIEKDLEDQCPAFGEEGYGQKRICKNCQKTSNVRSIIASREMEDWRGLATTQETQSRGRYLQGSIENEFLLEKNI